MKKVKWRTGYNDEQEREIRERSAIDFSEDVSLTQQQYKDDVDINVMMYRMGVRDDAKIPTVPISDLVHDFGEATDLRTIFETVEVARQTFAALPADIRQRFGNNPAQMMDFVNDPKHEEEAVKMGLLFRPEKEKPAGAAAPPVVTDTQK